MATPFLLLRISSGAPDEDETVAAADSYVRSMAARNWDVVCAQDTACGIDDIVAEIRNFAADHEGKTVGVVAECTSLASGSILSFMCEQLKNAADAVHLAFLLISVPSVRVLDETGMLPHVKGSSEVAVYVSDDEKSFTLGPGGLTYSSPSVIIREARAPADRPVGASDLSLRFGHFSSYLDQREIHTNIVPHVQTVEGDKKAWRRLIASARTAIEAVTDIGTVIIVPVDWVGAELGRLALELAGGLDRIVQPGHKTHAPEAPHITLASAPLPETVHRRAASNRNIPLGPGLSHLNLVGVVDGVPSLVKLPDMGGAFEPWNCPYCAQGTPLEGNAYDLLAAEYHPKIFWDLLAWDERHVLTGHWRSPTTTNHFNLKIESRPLFDAFADSIAERMTNALAGAGVLPEWIEGIICTDGDESSRLVPALAERLNVATDCILKVDHPTRAVAARPGLDRELSDWAARNLASNRRLATQNVLLVDQAAHHLNTLSALRKVASVLGARPLAFTVFVDRTGFATEHAGTLYHGLHFVPLYQFDSPPWRAFECPCRMTPELHL